MIHSEDTNYAETLVAFATTEKQLPAFGEDDLFRFRRKYNMKTMLAALPVNNYLKTPEEIETEFLCLLHNRKKGGTTILVDGYTDIHDINGTLTGFMEENY